MCDNYYNGEDFWASTKTPIGTGQYKIDSISNGLITLSQNENYRNGDRINQNIKKINVYTYNQVGELYNGFKLGNIDIINTSTVQYKEYIGTLGYYVKEYLGREYDYLACNCDDYIMKDVAVRQAINYAIDKANVVSTVYNNSYVTSQYPLDYGSYLYSSNYESNSDLELAKQTLMNGGWRYSNNRWVKNGWFLTFTISVNSSNSKRVQTANLIKAQLQNIGITVNIRELNDAQYKYCLENKNYQVMLTGVYNAVSPGLEYFYGEGNIANYRNKNVTNLINEVNSITDEKILKEKYFELIQVTMQDCPYISLYRNKGYLVINKKISGNFAPSNFSIFNNFESWRRQN